MATCPRLDTSSIPAPLGLGSTFTKTIWWGTRLHLTWLAALRPASPPSITATQSWIRTCPRLVTPFSTSSIPAPLGLGSTFTKTIWWGTRLHLTLYLEKKSHSALAHFNNQSLWIVLDPRVCRIVGGHSHYPLLQAVQFINRASLYIFAPVLINQGPGVGAGTRHYPCLPLASPRKTTL